MEWGVNLEKPLKRKKFCYGKRQKGRTLVRLTSQPSL